MQKGFLLLETAVVSFLVVTAALICTSYAVLNRQREVSEAQYTAVFLAQEQLARIEADAAHYKNYSGEITWLGSGNGVSIGMLNGRSYQVRTDMGASAAGPGIREVIVHVTWENGERQQEQIYRKLVDCGE